MKVTIPDQDEAANAFKGQRRTRPRLFGASALRSRALRCLVFTMWPRGKRRKEAAAAKFFIRNFANVDPHELDRLIRQLWTEHRSWDRICATIGEPNEHSFVLDVGGGLTSVARILATPYRWVLDICVEELRRAGMAMPKAANYIQGHAERIPFPDNFFTHVFCSNALDHFADPMESLREMRRVLRPEAHVVITVDVFPQDLGARDLRHPHTFTERSAIDMLSALFSVVDSFPRRKVGVRHLIAGEPPRHQKREMLYALRLRH